MSKNDLSAPKEARRQNLGAIRITVLAVIGVVASWNIVTYCEAGFVELYQRSSLLVRTGTIAARDFDEKGIVKIGSARNQALLTSPFYVVHYGLIYSESVRRGSPLWLNDPTQSLWPYPPPERLNTPQNFLAACDWIVSNTTTQEGGYAHLLYDFPWKYRNVRPDTILPPWWSGLTDALAIELLCRGYDVTGNQSYMQCAASLYASVLAPIQKGGSMLSDEQGGIMIEEYVDPNGSVRSRVLNGAIYSAMAVYNYEQRMKILDGKGIALLKSLVDNISRYDINGTWSYYDQVGTVANLKYHKINAALIKWIGSISENAPVVALAKKWENARYNPIRRAFIQGYFVLQSWFMCAVFIIIAIAISCTLYFIMRFCEKKYSNVKAK